MVSAVKRWIITGAVVITVVIAVPLACIAIELMGLPAGGGSVVLIEHLGQSRGRLVNGTYPAPELPGKSYAYDATGKVLVGGGIVVNDTLRAVVAVTRSLAQDAGDGAEGAAYGLYCVPSAADGIALRDVASDGTVSLTYNGSEIVLAPGERWEQISTEIVSTPSYSIRFTKADAIRNNGFVSLPAP